MSYPTKEQLADWASTLNGCRWEVLATRLNAAIERDRRGGTAIPDGYPNGCNGTGGHPGFTVEDDNGDPEFVPATSVELVALARQHARDEHHDRTIAALAHMQHALASLASLVCHLDRIDARSVTPPDSEGDPGCVSCRRDAGYFEPTALGRYARHCRFCGEWSAANGCDPPLERVRAKHEGRRIMTPVGR